MSRIGLVATAWLFTRGAASVRLVRVTHPARPTRLLVYGPVGEAAEHVIDVPMDVALLQSELKRRLVRAGFHLARFHHGKRRSGADRRGLARGADRRRTLRQLV